MAPRSRVPDASSAHSLYGQVFSGMGLVGLVMLLSILGRRSPGTARALWDPGTGTQQLTVVLLAAFGSLVGMAATGWCRRSSTSTPCGCCSS